MFQNLVGVSAQRPEESRSWLGPRIV